MWGNGLCYVLMTGLAIVFLGSGSLLLKDFLANRKHEKDLEGLAALFQEAAQREGELAEEIPEAVRSVGDTIQGGETDDRFRVYQLLKEQNDDFAGWIRIDGTRIDYPVVQTPGRPGYYLHRDFNQESSKYGTPYLEENCRYEEPGTNLLIYGHHMKNGGMFADLQKYIEAEFYRQHPSIRFDTLEREGNYEVVAVVKADASGNVTPWRELLFPKDEETFEAAWKMFKQQSFYQTGVEAEYTDRLLALVTCEYTLKDGRLMVVTKEMR